MKRALVRGRGTFRAAGPVTAALRAAVMIALGLVIAVHAPPTQAAAPVRVPVQGLVRDNAGAPVDGDFGMTFALYAAVDAEVAVWTEARPGDGHDCAVEATDCVAVEGGLFAVQLGDVATLDASVFAASSDLWLGVSVEGEPELPRQRLGASPYAGYAHTAGAIACTGCIPLEALDPGVADALGGQLPADGLAAVSNGLMTNVFMNSFAATSSTPIPDYFPPGATSQILVPDVGTAQALWVSADISNTDLSTVTVTLFPPNNEPIVLWDQTGPGTDLVATWPDPDSVVSGSLEGWVGANLAGSWLLQVVDNGFWAEKPPATNADGAINSWSIAVQTLSTKQVEVDGLLIAPAIELAGEDLTTRLAAIEQAIETKVPSTVSAELPDQGACTPDTAGEIWLHLTGSNVYICDGTTWRWINQPVPLSPKNLTAQSLGVDTVRLSWLPVDYAASYTVSQSSDGTVFADIATDLTETHWDVAGLQPFQSTWFRVVANNDRGQSGDAELEVTIGFGTGSDGPLTVAGDVTVNSYTTPTATAATGSLSLTVEDAGDFDDNDEVLVIQMRGPGAGSYGFHNVTVVGPTLQLSPALTFDCITTGGAVCQVVRVPQYESVTLLSGGRIVAKGWDGATGGVVALRSQGKVLVPASSSISADGRGFRGGVGHPSAYGQGTSGESYDGAQSQSTSANYGGGGGGGGGPTNVGAAAGGGAHATAGGDGADVNYGSEIPGAGGIPYGDDLPGTLFAGSGGGGGGHDQESGSPGDGGPGGGIILIFATEISGGGEVVARGAEGVSGCCGGEQGGGGGGAGGSVRLVAPTIEVAAVRASGGAGGSASNGSWPSTGGSGGDGRIWLSCEACDTQAVPAFISE